MIIIKDIIEQVIQDRGLNNKRLAEILKINESTISRVRRGNRSGNSLFLPLFRNYPDYFIKIEPK